MFLLPWLASEDVIYTIAAADGLLVRDGGWGSVVIARSEASDFVDRLYAAGAIYVADARVLGGCFTVANSTF